MKKLFLALFISLSHFVQSQQPFLEISNDLKEGRKKVHTAFSIVDEETSNFAIFLDDDNKMYGFLYSPMLELIGRFSSEGLPKKYGQIIGYSIQGEKIRLFLKDGKNKTFGSVLFNFENGKTEETLYDFKLKNELYVEGYTDGSKFYLITILKDTNTFHVYVFEEGVDFSKVTLDLSNEQFFDNLGATRSLNTIMAKGGKVHIPGSNYLFKVDKIDPESPNSIETTSEIVKMYPGKHGFKFAVDTQRRTYIIDVATKNLNYRLSTIDKPFLTAPVVNSNSFILNDKIYLLSSSNEEMVFSVKLLETGEELKNILVQKDDEISFKNSPIIQEGGKLKDYRELDKTSKFLRRLSKENIGIPVTKSNNDYVVIMGSKKEVASGGAPMMMPGFGFPMATAGAFTVTFNPTFFAYGSYTSTKATRIECLFDQDFKHKSGDIPKNIFDKINEAADRFPTKDAETVFRLDDSYIWGFYNKALNKYITYRF